MSNEIICNIFVKFERISLLQRTFNQKYQIRKEECYEEN